MHSIRRARLFVICGAWGPCYAHDSCMGGTAGGLENFAVDTRAKPPLMY